MFNVHTMSTDVLPIVCAICRESVHPHEGFLSVALSVEQMVSHRLGSWDDDGHTVAYWRTAHYGCHPDTEVVSYGIDLYRACTPRQLLLWTVHLSEKPWLDNTTWMSLLRTVGEQAQLDTGIWFPAA